MTNTNRIPKLQFRIKPDAAHPEREILTIRNPRTHSVRGFVLGSHAEHPFVMSFLKDEIVKANCDPDHVAKLINKAKRSNTWHNVYKEAIPA